MHRPNEGDTITCPRCGSEAIYSERTAITERDGKTCKDREPTAYSKYSKGWCCSNGTCDFSEALPMEVPS